MVCLQGGGHGLVTGRLLRHLVLHSRQCSSWHRADPPAARFFNVLEVFHGQNKNHTCLQVKYGTVPALPNTLAREELTPGLQGSAPKSVLQAEGVRDPLKHQG